jgi:hypothetical protein
LLTACSVNPETKVISEYLEGYGKDISNYRVICFVPADGCNSCIEPSLKYSETAGENFLLVLTSLYSKSIHNTVEAYHLDIDRILVDAKNKAVSLQLLLPTAPCFYFIEDGRVAKKADLSKTYDKTGILSEADRFLGKSAGE